MATHTMISERRIFPASPYGFLPDTHERGQEVVKKKGYTTLSVDSPCLIYDKE
jgi:hypothetical protein